MVPPHFAESRIRRLLLVGVLALGGVLYGLGLPDNPPGFYLDESSLAYNALSIAESGRDEHGAAWPTFFEAFGEYKSAPYVYLLAGVLKVTGPSILATRAVSATVGLVTVVLLALLASRLGGRALAGWVVGLSALLTPWLFEISRLVFEVVLVPLALAGFLLLLRGAAGRQPWPRRHVVGLGVLLGLLTYAYSSGRLLGPALALGLVLFVPRAGMRNVAPVWLVYGLTLVPLAVYAARHPGALGTRFELTSYLDDGGSVTSIVTRFADHYLAAFGASGLLLDGDPNLRHHVQFAGNMLIGTVALAAAGTFHVLSRLRADPWWQFVIYGTLVAPIPGAVTVDRFHSLRLAALPVFLLILAAAGVEWLWRPGRRQALRQVALGVLVGVTLLQGAIFQFRYHEDPGDRTAYFDAEFPEVLRVAETLESRGIRSLGLYSIDGRSYMHCLWYSALAGRDRDRCRDAGGGMPPPGAVAISQRPGGCDGCVRVHGIGTFTIYRVDGGSDPAAQR